MGFISKSGSFYSQARVIIAEVRDIFGGLNSSGGNQPILPPKQTTRPSSEQREMISNSLIALPRPPSRHGTAILSGNGTIGRPRVSAASPLPTSLLGTESPKLSLAKQDSKSDLASSGPMRPAFGTSRGPSPLTLGLSDIVPLAVAFQEVCHACFRGADELQSQVRLIGDMMVSFPAGIVQVIATNPNCAPLNFRIKNASVLESVVPNKNLISE